METNEQYDSCLEAPAFIYNTTYWVDWAHDKYRVNIVHYSGSTGYLGYTDSYTSGIRPVITISKDLV